MRKARQSFLKKNIKAAATNLHLAARYLSSEAMNALPAGRRALAASAEELNRLADAIQKGTIKSVKKLDDAFARAEHALAFHHVKKATRALASNRTRKAGYYLKSAATHLEGAVAWAGHELAAGTVAVIDEVRLLGGKMIDGSGFIIDEAGKGISAIGREVETFGKVIEPDRY